MSKSIKKLKTSILEKDKTQIHKNINEILVDILKVSTEIGEDGGLIDVGAALKASDMLSKLNSLETVGARKKPVLWKSFRGNIFESPAVFELAMKECQIFCNNNDHPFTIQNFMIYCGVVPSLFEEYRYNDAFKELFECLFVVTESGIVDNAITNRYNSSASKMLLEKQYDYESEVIGDTVIKIESISSRDDAEEFKRKGKGSL